MSGPLYILSFDPGWTAAAALLRYDNPGRPAGKPVCLRVWTWTSGSRCRAEWHQLLMRILGEAARLVPVGSRRLVATIEIPENAVRQPPPVRQNPWAPKGTKKQKPRRRAKVDTWVGMGRCIGTIETWVQVPFKGRWPDGVEVITVRQRSWCVAHGIPVKKLGKEKTPAHGKHRIKEAGDRIANPDGLSLTVDSAEAILIGSGWFKSQHKSPAKANKSRVKARKPQKKTPAAAGQLIARVRKEVL